MPDPSLAALLQAAHDWKVQDPDPKTRAQTHALIEAADPAVLRECFGQRLEFGTAGIRGRMGPGPGQMNRALVRMVSAGLGRYLLREGAGAVTAGVVVGFDGRHNSRDFAEDTARVLGGLGIPVFLFDDVVPTPVLAHAVTFMGAAGGVMVTASHNPPEDNGYKAYWANGAQIIPPHDAGISAEIDAVQGADSVRVPELQGLRDSGLLRAVPGDAWNDYERKVLGLRVHAETGAVAVYSAMHGVGYASLVRVLAGAGHKPVISVRSQQDPDGDFPTVRFPNPEEPGAMDEAIALATARGADVVLANDPDADRLAVAIPDGRAGWTRLTGNEVGVLLADDLLRFGPQVKNRMVATTIVSTSLLGRIAEANGAALVETLTGFKWIANAALDHDGPFVIGFEEALGYSAGSVVRDKDGVSTAMLFLDLASWCKARGVSLRDHLEDLYRRYGYAASAQRSLVMPGLDGAAQISAIMDALRADPPRSIGGVAVRRIRDIETGEALDLQTGAKTPIRLPTSNVLAFDMAEGCRVLARPSGTEPKIKFYFEATADLAEGEPLSAAKARAEARIGALAADLMARVGQV